MKCCISVMEHCGTLMAVCGEKVSWFECRSWAWPLNPQARRAWKCCSQYCLSEGNLYRKIQTRSYTDGSWREREKEVQSPLAGRISQANTRFFWEQMKGKGCSQRTEWGFFTRWRTKTTTLYHSPKSTLCNIQMGINAWLIQGSF